MPCPPAVPPRRRCRCRAIPTPAAHGRGLGVTDDDLYLCEGHATRSGHHLLDHRIAALPAFGDARRGDRHRQSPSVSACRNPATRSTRRPGRKSRPTDSNSRRSSPVRCRGVCPVRAARSALRAARVIHHLQQLSPAPRAATAVPAPATGQFQRITVRADVVAAPELHRIHTQLRRGQIHQALADQTGDRMAHRAILAVHRLVLEDRAGDGR